jgi:predicted GNAT family acetyltransferase
MSTPDLTVTDDVASSRFTLHLGGEIVSLADYSLDDAVVTVPHVETAPAHRGQGLAAVLMDGVVESIRANGRTIRPICSYAASYLRERPDTHDLVAR